MSAAPKMRGLRPLRQEITDLPNIITLIRMAMIPVILFVVDHRSPTWSLVAALLFIVAAASDALDGYLARRLGLITVVGKFLDPLADKLIVLSVLVYLVAFGRAPAWLVVILMARELSITSLRAIASQQSLIITPGTSGKLKTTLQLVGISLLLVHFPRQLGAWQINPHQLGTYVLYASLVLSLLSAVQYFQFFEQAASEQARRLEKKGVSRARLQARARRRRAKIRYLRAGARRQRRLRARRAKKTS